MRHATIGEYTAAVAARSLFSPKTLQSYAQALRKIVGDIYGVAHKGPRADWRVRVDGIKLATLTNEKIEAWRIDSIRRKATDPLKEKSARISVSSFLLRGRALFSAKMVARVRGVLELPEPLPFVGVKVETVRVPRYRSTFDVVALLEDAREELASARPEQYKILLLGPGAYRGRRARRQGIACARRVDRRLEFATQTRLLVWEISGN